MSYALIKCFIYRTKFYCLLLHQYLLRRLVDVLAADPKNVDALFCMGLVHYGQKRLSKAKELLEEAVEVNPHHKNVLHYLAKLHEEEGNCSGAVKHLLKLLELEPNELTVAIRLGNCYHSMRERQKGREVFEEVLRKDPTNQVALNNLGKIDYKSLSYCRG